MQASYGACIKRPIRAQKDIRRGHIIISASRTFRIGQIIDIFFVGYGMFNLFACFICRCVIKSAFGRVVSSCYYFISILNVDPFAVGIFDDVVPRLVGQGTAVCCRYICRHTDTVERCAKYCFNFIVGSTIYDRTDDRLCTDKRTIFQGCGDFTFVFHKYFCDDIFICRLIAIYYLLFGSQDNIVSV